MASIKFAHVGISCNDQAATEKFYTAYFGFKRSRLVDLGSSKIIFLRNDDDVHLELFRADEERPVPRSVADGPHYAELRHLAFQVDDVDEVLKAMGTEARITLGPVGFDDFIKGWKTVWLKDPDGNIVEVSQGYRDEG